MMCKLPHGTAMQDKALPKQESSSLKAKATSVTPLLAQKADPRYRMKTRTVGTLNAKRRPFRVFCCFNVSKAKPLNCVGSVGNKPKEKVSKAMIREILGIVCLLGSIAICIDALTGNTALAGRWL